MGKVFIFAHSEVVEYCASQNATPAVTHLNVGSHILHMIRVDTVFLVLSGSTHLNFL